MPGSPAVKRSFDLLAAVVGLVLLAPVMAAIGLAVRLRLGSPVLFRQIRPGLGGRPFTLVKFRTMRDAADGHGRPLPDSDRLTRFGRLLRSTSLDELPELWNVIRGDMSIVGPRPLLTEYLPLYSEQHARRHDVRPGITGWAQVNGRNALSWTERLDLDAWYAAHHTLWLDLRILVMTVAAVLTRRGISADGEATVRRFAGYDG
jgi:lipopolysaccharide/colanic/teichoic acid biosynthesis glycosyltransferase